MFFLTAVGISATCLRWLLKRSTALFLKKIWCFRDINRSKMLKTFIWIFCRFWGQLYGFLYEILDTFWLVPAGNVFFFFYKSLIAFFVRGRTVGIVRLNYPYKRRSGLTPDWELQIIARAIHGPVRGGRIANRRRKTPVGRALLHIAQQSDSVLRAH